MEKVGPYVIIGRLATGGMAEVFLARREGPAGFEKIQVVKRILPQFAEDPEFSRMFLDEARLAALINHPNVVQIFELGGTRDALYIAMEFVPGFDLAKVMDLSLKQRRLLPAAVSARIVADAAAGLDFAHRLIDANGVPRGIVHRDISPENLLVSEVGQVKVVDFGIARATTGHQLSGSGRLKGKVHYHAPEHIQSKPVDGKADVYALGVVLYELLCARRPFEGMGEVEVMRATVDIDPPPPSKWYPTAEPELSEVALRALARDPAARLTAAQLRDELELWLRRNPCTAADIERYLLEVIPLDSPERTRARKLLQDAPVRQATEPHLPPPSAKPPPPDDHTVRDSGRVRRLRALIPLAIVALLTFGAVTWALTRPPLPATHTPAPAPQVISVPTPPPEGNEIAIPAPKPAPEHPHVRELRHPSAAHHASPPKPSPARTYLTVRVSPRCHLYVDDERAERPVNHELTLSPGPHQLHFVNRSLHLDARRTVELASGKHATEHFTFVRKAVTVRVSPWAYVTIDGTDYGPTPLTRTLALYEGGHAVQLRNPKMHKNSHTVELQVRDQLDNKLIYSFPR